MIADFFIIFYKNSRSYLEPENRSQHFSFRNSRYGYHISLSLLDFTFCHLVNAWLGPKMGREWFQNIFESDNNFDTQVETDLIILLKPSVKARRGRNAPFPGTAG